jgi:lipoate-protein ligase A
MPPTGHDSDWRLIISGPAPGAANMALDEAILEAVSRGDSQPTLRLYAWQPACLSLGVAQSANEVDRTALARESWGLVRRPTGGRAILHTDELTYAVMAPIDNAHVAGGILDSYRHLSLGLLAGLQGLSLAAEAAPIPANRPAREQPVCFENPSAYEITVGGRKLIGSAQVRRRRGVLQHGTLPLGGDLTRICRILTFESDAERAVAAARLQRKAATVEELTGVWPAWEDAAMAVRHGFEVALDLRFQVEPPTAAELERAQALARQRYASEKWTFRL